MTSARSARVEVSTKVPTGITGFDQITGGGLPRGRTTLLVGGPVLEVRAKSLQTELVAKQVEKTLLARTTEARERELTRGRERMQELRGADASILDRKANKK